MSDFRQEQRHESERQSAVELYCMAAILAEQASRCGFSDLSRRLEDVLDAFLSVMDRDQQAEALRLSYEMTLENVPSAPAGLRLVYSRD